MFKYFQSLSVLNYFLNKYKKFLIPTLTILRLARLKNFEAHAFFEKNFFYRKHSNMIADLKSALNSAN